MIAHKEENGQERHTESNCFHVVPVHWCLYLKKEDRNTHFAARFQKQQLPLVQHLFKVSVPPWGHESTAAALQRGTAWEHRLQSIQWRHAKPNTASGRHTSSLPCHPREGRSREGPAWSTTEHQQQSQKLHWAVPASGSLYHKIIKPLNQPLLHMASILWSIFNQQQAIQAWIQATLLGAVAATFPGTSVSGFSKSPGYPGIRHLCLQWKLGLNSSESTAAPHWRAVFIRSPNLSQPLSKK